MSEMNNDVSPDTLMGHFKGKGMMPIIMFTLVVHFVVIIGSSVPFFIRTAMKRSSDKLPEDERLANATEDATVALRKIAKQHGLNPQDISRQLSGGSRGAAAPPVEAPVETDEPDDAGESGSEPGDEPEREKSEYEKSLETSEKGPTVPTFADDKDDIF